MSDPDSSTVLDCLRGLASAPGDPDVELAEVLTKLDEDATANSIQQVLQKLTNADQN